MRVLRLALFLPLLVFASPAASQVSPEVRSAWGFDGSQLAPHSGVRFGVLPNGMRYAIMRHDRPSGGLAVRLRFDVGSTVEGTDERGMMHLLEHMVFEGTGRLPQRRLLDLLARSGLTRSGDFNALTEPHDTVYRLDLARADAEAVEGALTVMREIGDGLIFPARLVERSKLRVRAELEARRVRERIADAQGAFLMPGTPLAERPAHGRIEDLRRATAGALRRLYRRWYVPQRATIVVVGDADPATVEAAIIARFGRWRPRPSRAADSAPNIDRQRPGEVRLFIDPEAPTAVTIASAAPLADEVDAAAPRNQAFLAHIGCAMLERRLAAAPAVESGECAVYEHFATARIARVDVAARARDWRGALAAADETLRTALEQGFNAAELQEQVARMSAAAARGTAPTSSAVADAIVASLQAGTVFTEPQSPEQFAAYLAGVRVENVNAAFRAAWAAAPGRLLFISHHQPIPDPPAPLE